MATQTHLKAALAISALLAAMSAAVCMRPPPPPPDTSGCAGELGEYETCMRRHYACGPPDADGYRMEHWEENRIRRDFDHCLIEQVPPNSPQRVEMRKLLTEYTVKPSTLGEASDILFPVERPSPAKAYDASGPPLPPILANATVTFGPKQWATVQQCAHAWFDKKAAPVLEMCMRGNKGYDKFVFPATDAGPELFETPVHFDTPLHNVANHTAVLNKLVHHLLTEITRYRNEGRLDGAMHEAISTCIMNRLNASERFIGTHYGLSTALKQHTAFCEGRRNCQMSPVCTVHYKRLPSALCDCSGQFGKRLSTAPGRLDDFFACLGRGDIPLTGGYHWYHPAFHAPGQMERSQGPLGEAVASLFNTLIENSCSVHTEGNLPSLYERRTDPCGVPTLWDVKAPKKAVPESEWNVIEVEGAGDLRMYLMHQGGGGNSAVTEPEPLEPEPPRPPMGGAVDAPAHGRAKRAADQCGLLPVLKGMVEKAHGQCHPNAAAIDCNVGVPATELTASDTSLTTLLLAAEGHFQLPQSVGEQKVNVDVLLAMALQRAFLSGATRSPQCSRLTHYGMPHTPPMPPVALP